MKRREWRDGNRFVFAGYCEVEMSRRVRQKVDGNGKEKVGVLSYMEVGNEEKKEVVVEWTRLPYDTVIKLFSSLSYRDRASLSSTCRAWRVLGSFDCLWNSLDLRLHKCDAVMAASLASRCGNLEKVRFRGAESAEAIINLRARNLREISGDYCRKITDATLSMIVARHEALECIQLGPDFCEKISSDAIRTISLCCPNLKKLRLSGIRDVQGDAINALAKNCLYLTEAGFFDCLKVDEIALGNLVSVRFLSVAGTSNIKWDTACNSWHKLRNLVALDVSRTDIHSTHVSRLQSSCPSLNILCALNCPGVEGDGSFFNGRNKGKALLSITANIFSEIASQFAETTKMGETLFLEWRNLNIKDRNLPEIMTWLEWILSHTLLRIAENNPHGLDEFWLKQGASLLLTLMQSAQEDVQERAATGLATFVVIDDENASIDCGRAETVLRDGGIRLLLDLVRSWREGLQSEAAKAIANLSVNANVAKAVAEEGGISILAGLARSRNPQVAEEAAGGLWNLSVGEEHKGAIAQAGGVRALVDLIIKWSANGDGVLERAAGALANLAADDKCSLEIANANGVNALVMLARTCKFDGVQEQAARALANLAAHGDSTNTNSIVGKEAGALEALVQLTRSAHEGVRQESAGALWNLSFDDRNREAIAAVGGVEALVTLAQSCTYASPGLQERAAGALWGLSVSEANSIAIGREGGIAPLITLAGSEAEEVHETAAGALWNLAFNPSNVFHIVREGGISALVHLCASSASKMARFMAALALTYIFDGRTSGFAPIGTTWERSPKNAILDAPRKAALQRIETFIAAFSDPQAFSSAAASSSPTALVQVTEKARLLEAGQLRCSGAELGRFIGMLRNPCPTLRTCAAFALLQFTLPGGRHAAHHASLMQNAGAARVLRAAAAAATAPLEAKIFARIVLRNLEQHHLQPCL